MDQIRARRIADVLRKQGMHAVAVNGGGWGGSPSSQIWQVLVNGVPMDFDHKDNDECLPCDGFGSVDGEGCATCGGTGSTGLGRQA